MADRTSAGLFADIFTMLASEPTDLHKAWALTFWRQSCSYDFSPRQMECDEALMVLGLARKRVGEDGEEIAYGPEGEDS